MTKLSNKVANKNTSEGNYEENKLSQMFGRKVYTAYAGSFPFVPPPPPTHPPSTLCIPQLQSTFHYIVNQSVNIARDSGRANTMHPLSCRVDEKDPVRFPRGF